MRASIIMALRARMDGADESADVGEMRPATLFAGLKPGSTVESGGEYAQPCNIAKTRATVRGVLTKNFNPAREVWPLRCWTS